VNHWLGQIARHKALSFPIAVQNQVLFMLVTVGTAVVVLSGFVGYAPNRLVSGTPIPLWAVVDGRLTMGIAALGGILLTACFLIPSKSLHYAVAALSASLLVLALAAAGHAASILATTAQPASRVSLGPAFWILAGCAALAVVDALQRLAAGTAVQVLATVAIVAGVVALATAGNFDALSIAREYESHRQEFADALLRHVTLVAASVGAALVIGFPLGVAAVRNLRLQGPLFAVLNILQTIPSIALFGLLIVPLSALVAAMPWLATFGISGIGIAPAVIALVLYALLPVVRNTSAGLAGVAAAAVEAGRGMGLTGRQIFWQLELPLALPVLLAGLRIVTVQTIGLAVVAALIGAGGLGIFVFEGLGQYAVDLVILGALPAIFLALVADFTLQVLSTVMRRRFAA
jgi:osmoprotectant transport system permease protein